MDGLLKLTLPNTISRQDSHTRRYLKEFINFVCSDTNFLEELIYWSDVSRLLPLLERCQLFFSILNKSFYNLDIQLVKDTYSKLLNFSISFLNFLSNIENSTSTAKLRILICSFIHGITWLPPLQIPQLSETDVSFQDNLFHLSTNPVLSVDHSTLQSHVDFRALIISHNRSSLQLFATKSLLLSITSSFSFSKSFASLDILFSINNFDYDVFSNEVLTLLYFTSIPELIDTSPTSLQILSDTCISAISIVSQCLFESTAQSSDKGFTHLFPSSFSKILKYTLEVCDNFTMILRFSHFPDYIEKNFRLFQTRCILRHMHSILYPNIPSTSTLINTHFDLSPRIIEISSWITSSVSRIFSEVKNGCTYRGESFTHEANLFTYSTPHSRVDYLFDQNPLLSIFFSLLVNGYSRWYASSAVSTILEYRNFMFIEKPSTIQISPSYVHFQDLRSSLTFLFACNIPIYGSLTSYQQLLFEHVESVASNISQYSSNRLYETLLLDHLFVNPNEVIRYYSQFANISQVATHRIPPPPPNIPIYSTSRYFGDPFPTSLNLNTLEALETSSGFDYSSIPTSYMQFCCTILSLIREIFLKSKNTVWCSLMNTEIECSHIYALCYIFNGIVTSSREHPVISPNCILNLSKQILSTFHCILFSDSFDYSLQVYFLDHIGLKFDKWPLYLSEPQLFILSWLVLYHMKTSVISSDHFSIRFLSSFISSLEQGLSDSNNDFGQLHDVNFPHIQIFLFCFSSIPRSYQTSCFIRITHLLQRFSNQSFITFTSNLIWLRVVLLFEYFLFHFTTPPQTLVHYIHSCFGQNATFSLNQTVPTSPFNDGLRDFFFNTEFRQLFKDSPPILYDILNRSNLNIDPTSLSVICHLYSENLRNYTVLYSNLFLHSISMGRMSLSLKSKRTYLLPHFYVFRYKSLKNILLHLPCFNLVFPPNSTPIDIYMTLSMNALCKSPHLDEHLSFLLPNQFHQSSFLRPIDVIHLAEKFFSTVSIFNTSYFIPLFVSTSIIYLLYETMSTLEQSLDISQENETKNHRRNRSLIKFLLSDVSARFVPLLFRFLNILSNECSLYLSEDSHHGSDVIENLMYNCAVSSCSDDLTHFSSTSNPELFDSSLTDSTKVALRSYYNVSKIGFDQLSLFGDCFFLNNYSLLDILELYMISLTVYPCNLYAPIFKHCISTISSFLQHILGWISDKDILSSYIPEIAVLIHKAPQTSLFAQGTIDRFIPSRFHSTIRDASTSLFLKNSFFLISLPQLRNFSNATTVLNTYYTILLQSMKDFSIYRLVCNILKNGSSFNIFSPLFLPIYPEFRNSLSLSIHTLADIFVCQKGNFVLESSIFVSQLNDSAFLNQQNIFSYFDYAMLGFPGEEEKKIEERCDKLLVFANAISTGCTILPASTCQFILKSIIPLGDKLLDFIGQLSTCCLDSILKSSDSAPDSSEFPLFSHPCLKSFFPTITGLAEVHNVHGELLILEAVLSWLPRCKDIVLTVIKNKLDHNCDAFMLQFGNACGFLSDLLEQIKLISSVVKILMKRDGFDGFIDLSYSHLESFDNRIDLITPKDDSDLVLSISSNISSNAQNSTSPNKKEATQHWYNCHTCNLTDDCGICTKCAKVCHKGHDVSYSRLSTIVCSCGYEGKQCSFFHSTITKSHLDEQPTLDNTKYPANLMIVNKYPPQKSFSGFRKSTDVDPELMELVEAIEKECGLKEELFHFLNYTDVSIHALEILSALVKVNKYCLFVSTSITSPLVRMYDQLHHLTKVFDYDEVLTGSILRSPEGIFENVKFSVNEESLTPKSLLTSSSVVRNSLCSVSSINSIQSQYLLVSLDKGKFTTINRSFFIKSDVNTNKNKLNIVQISNGNVPFTVIRMVSNPLCENFVAFCGIQECCVVVLHSNGQIPEKSLPVQVGIESSNYIVKAFWLPLSRTTLAIVTSQFIKIFDLSIDSFSPIYYFYLESDYIVDSTFISASSSICLYLMTHSGDVFYQAVSPQCIAENGPVFISSKVEVFSDQSLHAGASIYYSHSLQLLFLSYADGVNLFGSFKEETSKLANIVYLTFKHSEVPVTVYEWIESYLQPGFFCAFSRTTSSPILICIQTRTIYVSEIVPDSSKSQLVGMALDVKSKHLFSEDNSALILLYDDGSLRVHSLILDKILPLQSVPFSISSPLADFLRKEKLNNLSFKFEHPALPVDVFEFCSICDDVEFGGMDVLHVYDHSQVKKRLTTEFGCIFNCKPTGFHIDIINTNGNIVFVGIRIKLGTKSILQSPTYIELFNRKIQLHFVNDKPRWFDIAFTRDESVHSIRSFQVYFGPSKDSNFHSFVDSLLVYSKTKEEFGWKDLTESERLISKSNFSPISAHLEEYNESQIEGIKGETEFERLTHLSLALLCESTAIPNESNSYALEVLTDVFLSCLDKPLKQYSSALIYNLLPNIESYFLHTDHATLIYVIGRLFLTPFSLLTPEFYQQLLLNLYSIAINRTYNISILMDNDFLRKCCDSFASSDHSLKTDDSAMTLSMSSLVKKIVSLFWLFFKKRPITAYYASICYPGLRFIKETVSIITAILYSFIVTDAQCIPLIMEYVFNFLESESDYIWLPCISTLCSLLRPKYCENMSYTTKEDDVIENSFEHTELNDEYSFSTDRLIEIQRLHENTSFVEEILPLSNQTSLSNTSTHCNEGSSQQRDGVPNVDNNISDIDLAVKIRNRKITNSELKSNCLLDDPSPDISSSTRNKSLGHLTDVPSMSQLDLSTSTSNFAGEQNGDQSSTGTLTPPTSFPLEAVSTNYPRRKKKSLDILGENSSDMGGDTSPDESESCTSQNASVNHVASKDPSDLNQYKITSSNAACRKTNSSLCPLILSEVLQRFHLLSGFGGLKAMHVMQLVLILMSGIHYTETSEKLIFNTVSKCLEFLRFNRGDVSDLIHRTSENEASLIVVRLLSILLVREKKDVKSILSKANLNTSAWHITACLLAQSSSFLTFCLGILKLFIENLKLMKSCCTNANFSSTTPVLRPCDLFYSSSSNNGKEKVDIFRDYEKVLIETIIRLPCQLKRICDSYNELENIQFSQEWLDSLSEYMELSADCRGPGRRNVRKLLLYLAGSRDNYRKLRDFNVYSTNMQKVYSLTHGQAVRSDAKCTIKAIKYDSHVQLLKSLSFCLDCASPRPIHWQTYCINNDITVPFLIFISTRLHEDICGSILHLICCAICGFDFIEISCLSVASNPSTEIINCFPNYDEYISNGISNDFLFMKFLHSADLEFAKENPISIEKLVTFFLLDVNSSNLRNLSLSFFWAIFSAGSMDSKQFIMELFWSLAEYMLTFGQKATQFVELLSHCSYVSPPIFIHDAGYLTQLIQLLKLLDEKIISHPNSSIYRILSTIVELDGYYLENQPCAICNNPEIPSNNLKLLSIKSDSKFTGNSTIFKLSNSYIISSIHLKITDIKRHKMVKTLKIYYSGRIFQSAVELKNAKYLCDIAKEFTLQEGQHEAKIQFILPIAASNLIFEYSDFYENEQSSQETLQCPRCSASVLVNPGVCGNCSENVFQCHKCRAINYDEKDAFLCNSCGFSKFGKFDYVVCAKLSSSVDKINNEQERTQTVNSTTNLLEKADQIYSQLLQHRQLLDLLLIHETSDVTQFVSKSKVEHISSGINKYISMINQKYSNDCKTSFNELSKTLQGVLACRQELICYDLACKYMPERISSDFSFLPEDFPIPTQRTPGFSQCFARFGLCYGCVASASNHCISILMNLSRIPKHKLCMIQMGLLTELCNTNLRIGTSTMQNEVRSFILRLNFDDARAAEELMRWLTARIRYLIEHHQSHPNFSQSVYHEILLLKSAMLYDDKFWEQRLRYLIRIFGISICHSTVIVLECITLPCLKILLEHVYFTSILSLKYAPLVTCDIFQSSRSYNTISIELKEWIVGKADSDFYCWKNQRTAPHNVFLSKFSWLKSLIFHPFSKHTRNSACILVKSMMKDKMREKLFIDLLFSYISDIPTLGRPAHDYLDLILSVFLINDWRGYLTSKGILVKLGEIISFEVGRITILEDSTIHVDISLGYALKVLSTLLYQLMCNAQLTSTIESSKNISLLSSFSEAKNRNHNFTTLQLGCLNDPIFLEYKNMLLPIVFDVYLSIKRLVIQRTKRVDDAQEMIFLLLELLTSGTFVERQNFVVLCIEKLECVPVTDHSTSIYIIEELCSIISPEDFEDPDVFITIEKDPQQEEFLQGRMQSNPYNVRDSSIGPLMRDVKNKICRDTELLALLEEDTGMELLVCNKIICLDLPVREVYRKVWLSKDSNAGNIMKITYRMRGLLGEATEDMIEYFVKENDDIEDEDKYIVSSVMSQCGGLDAIICRMRSLHNPLHSVKLLIVSLKLLSLCVKLKVNRRYLLKCSMNSINTLLNIFTSIIEVEDANEGIIGVKTLEIILQILFSILHEASSSSFLPIDSEKTGQEKVRGDIDQFKLLFSCIKNSFVQRNIEILRQTMKLIPYLTYGDEVSMQVILDYFSSFLNFERHDDNPLSEHSLYLDCFCTITEGITSDNSGLALKDMILDSGIVFAAIKYIHKYTPHRMFQQLDADWDVFLNRPSLPFVLRFLGGICINHLKSQTIIAEIIPNLHLTEKATTSKGIGTLAENLLNNLVSDERIYSSVEKARSVTHLEQVHLAQEFQKRSLAELGITICDGKIQMDFSTDATSIMEESGLICCICMEGYINHPRKILGIYTFFKSCQMEDFENTSRRTQGYTSVSGFNVVHLDCHNTAIRTGRQSRGKEEWESASIHNSNIRCNSLIPVWGPEVRDNGYLSCLAKHHSSLQDSTGFREPSFWSSVHDLKILLFRYGFNTSFTEETGGGSRLSNMQYVCYYISYTLYILHNSSSITKEQQNIDSFFHHAHSEWVMSSYSLDSPLYFLVASIFILSGEDWASKRLIFLERVILVAHSRFHSISPISLFPCSDVLEYSVYRPYLIVYGIVTRIHDIFMKLLIRKSDNFLLDIIQEYKIKDRSLLIQFESLISFYEEELLPAESFSEFCDVMHILDLIPDPVLFLSKLVSAFHNT